MHRITVLFAPALVAVVSLNCASGGTSSSLSPDEAGPTVPVTIQYLELDTRRDVHRIDVFLETGERNRRDEGRQFVGMVWRDNPQAFRIPLSFVTGERPYFATVKREGSDPRTSRRAYDTSNPRVQRVRSCLELLPNDSLSLLLDPYRIRLTVTREGEDHHFETDWCP